MLKLSIKNPLLALGTFGVLFTGCSLKPLDQKSVRISLPTGLQQRLASTRGLAPHASRLGQAQTALIGPDPSTFKCIGINVTAPDIPMDLRFGPADPMSRHQAGIMGGLVPFRDGEVLDIQVPSGYKRFIQLFALSATIPCPNIQDVANHMATKSSNDNGYPGLDGDPMIIGEAVVDILSDMDVPIRYSYDPLNAQCFMGCHGENHGVPPTLAYFGYKGTTWGMANYTQSSLIMSTPDPNLGAFDITQINDPSQKQFTLAELQSFGNWVKSSPGSPPPFNFADRVVKLVDSLSQTEARRAAVQLQWQLSDTQYTETPYARITVQATGGAIQSNGTNCPAPMPTPSPAGAAIGLAVPSIPGWAMKTSFHSDSNQKLDWFEETDELSNIFVDKNGTKHVIVNVESNYYGKGDGTCQSYVGLGGAGLQLSAVPFPLEFSPRPQDGEATVSIYANQQFHFNVKGGKKPYNTPTITMNSAGDPSVTPMGSSSWYYYVGPEGGTIDTLTVTDALGTTSNLQVQVIAPPPTSFSGSFGPLMGSTCYNYTVNFTGGLPMSTWGQISLSGSGSLHPGGCDQASTGPWIDLGNLPTGTPNYTFGYTTPPTTSPSNYLYFYGPGGLPWAASDMISVP